MARSRASITYGCSLHHIRLQPLLHTVTGGEQAGRHDQERQGHRVHRRRRRRRRQRGMAKVPPWQRPNSAPASPQGAPGGSGRLGTPRVEARPPGGRPRPQLFERAASKVARFTAPDCSGSAKITVTTTSASASLRKHMPLSYSCAAAAATLCALCALGCNHVSCARRCNRECLSLQP